MARRKAVEAPVVSVIDNVLTQQLLKWRAIPILGEEVMFDRDGVPVRLRHEGNMTENILTGIFIEGTGWMWSKIPVVIGLEDAPWIEYLFSEIDTHIASRTK
jgi:hypothetical protein